jgi:hypothetical protein
VDLDKVSQVNLINLFMKTNIFICLWKKVENKYIYMFMKLILKNLKIFNINFKL